MVCWLYCLVLGACERTGWGCEEGGWRADGRCLDEVEEAPVEYVRSVDEPRLRSIKIRGGREEEDGR